MLHRIVSRAFFYSLLMIAGCATSGHECRVECEDCKRLSYECNESTAIQI
jgi:hypothetical protein